MIDYMKHTNSELKEPFDSLIWYMNHAYTQLQNHVWNNIPQKYDQHPQYLGNCWNMSTSLFNECLGRYSETKILKIYLPKMWMKIVMGVCSRCSVNLEQPTYRYIPVNKINQYTLSLGYSRSFSDYSKLQ